MAKNSVVYLYYIMETISQILTIFSSCGSVNNLEYCFLVDKYIPMGISLLPVARFPYMVLCMEKAL